MKSNFKYTEIHNTSNDCEFSDKKFSWWDLPLCLEIEDLTEAPEARTGIGDGEMMSQGEAEDPVPGWVKVIRPKLI